MLDVKGCAKSHKSKRYHPNSAYKAWRVLTSEVDFAGYVRAYPKVEDDITPIVLIRLCFIVYSSIPPDSKPYGVGFFL